MGFFVTLTFLFLLLFSLSFLHPYFHKSPKNINKGFKIYPIVGILPGFLKNRHRLLDWITEVLNQTPTNTAVLRRLGNVRGITTANPLNVEHMLKINFENYPKGYGFISVLRDFLGQGIFNSDGEIWKVQRKTASYEFNTKSLRYFVMENVTVEIKTRLVPGLEKASETNQVLDIQDILERFAFDNICKVSFNVDPCCLAGEGFSGNDTGEFMKSFEEAAALSAGRFRYAFPYLWKIKKFLNVGSESRLRKCIATVHRFADDIIRSRMESGKQNSDEDLLSRFIGCDEGSPEFLRDIIISFILAGRDTTSSALTWFFWILSSRPDIEKKILNELESIRARNGKEVGETYSFNELRDMHYLHAAISESMRLYPPVPADTKVSRNDDVMPDGTFVGKDWFVTYHVYAMGRMEKIWGKNCLEFVPERWLENGEFRPESQYRYPIFQAGPRICLGKDMAFIQMKSIAATVIEMFQIVVEEKAKRPDYVLSLTLRMKGGLPIRVRKRRVAGN